MPTGIYEIGSSLCCWFHPLAIRSRCIACPFNLTDRLVSFTLGSAPRVVVGIYLRPLHQQIRA